MRQLILPSAHENLAAFLAILSWVTDQVGHSPKATGWRVELRLAVAWTHSNRLFTLLRSAGAKPEWIERLFSQPIYGLRTEMFEHDVTGYYDIAHPRNVSSEKLLMSGLSYAVSGKEGQILTDQTRQTLLEAATQELEGHKFPRISLMHDPTRADNCLQSFLGADRGIALSKLIGDEAAKVYYSKSLRELVSHAIRRLLERKEIRLSWAQIAATIAFSVPYRGTKAPLQDAVLATDFAQIFAADDEEGCSIIHSASTMQILAPRTKVTLYLENQLIRIAELLSDKTQRDDNDRPNLAQVGQKQDARLFMLLGAALNIALQSGNQTKATSCFASLLERMVDVCPKLAEVAQPIAQCLCNELPASQAQKFWPILTKMRGV